MKTSYDFCVGDVKNVSFEEGLERINGLVLSTGGGELPVILPAN